MESRSKSLLKNTAILTLGNICTKGIMFIITPLLTRWLSQADYGLFDLFTSYTSLIIPLITLDIGEAAFRFLIDKEADEEKKKIIRNSTSVYLLSFALAEIVLIIIALTNSKLSTSLPAFSVLIIAEAIYLYFTLLLRGLKKLDCYAVANILFVLTMAIGALLFVKILNLQLSGIIFAYAMGYIVSSIYMAWRGKLLHFTLPPHIDKKEMKEMLKYSIPLLPNAVSWWIVGVSDRTIVSIILGTSTNAVYSVAGKIPNFGQNIFNLFHLSWQQTATEAVGDKDRDKFYSNTFNKTFSIMASLMLCIISADFLLFGYMFPTSYYEAYYLMPILCLSLVFSMMGQFLGGIYVAGKESVKTGKTTSIAAIINIIVHLALIIFIGVYAAAVSTLISYISLFLIRYVDISKRIKISISRYNIYLVIIVVFITAIVYINNIVLNCTALMVAMGVFIIVNKNDMTKITKMMINKIKK